MAHLQLRLIDVGLDVGVQIQQPQQVGHRGAGLADGLRDLLVGQLELVQQPVQGAGLLQWIEVGPLDVLDQADGDRGGLVDLADDHRDIGEPSLLGGPPAPFTGDDLVAVVAERPHHDGLDHALDGDRVRQLAQGVGVEVAARLIAPALDAAPAGAG